MCSVVGCVSLSSTNQRFKLPEDPEQRLEWVQFLATVNKQRFKESSWTDITICSQHFKDDCFEKLTPSGTVRLKPGAVPSLCLRPESDQPETDQKSQTSVESVETAEVAPQCDELDTESALTSVAAQESPVVPIGVSCSTDAFISLYSQLKQDNVNIDLIREKATLLKMKGKYIVNEERLLQLFSSMCPSCGGKLQMEKFTNGVLISLNQQCLQCQFRNQWKNQVNAAVLTAKDQHLTGGTDVTPETQQSLSQEVSTDDKHSSVTGLSENVALVDQQSDPADEMESSDEGEVESDDEWKPRNTFLLTKQPQKESDDDEDESDEIEEDDFPTYTYQHSQLCTECGKFYAKWRRHTCEHKIKPYSCNTCGKRCVSENALNTHSRVHDDNHEYRCKYCHVTFKTKVDKMTHEKIHLTEGTPYKCTDCSETFATNKERRIHLDDHRGPRELKCDICGIEFLSHLNLQRHKVVHTGLRPFKCSVCQRGFNQAGHLKSHMRLHTGERPYKCQHCDKCFNHNVSLKSHVQRYHASISVCEPKEINKRASDSGDAQENGDKRDSDSDDSEEEEDDSDSDVQNDRIGVSQKKKRSTGRPIGRPKSSTTGSSAQTEGRGSNTKNAKVKPQKLKRTRCSDEESEDEQTDISFDSAEREVVKSKRERKSTKSGSDSDFDPEEREKMSSQKTCKSPGKRRGRPRKNVVI
ncbi:zinc finger protein 426-like [Scomber scombrus]|uniref:zinc finger protein 426-like n=1 Tax=Scomber scombrus TaxID=13677 RepID=UPI002DD911CC|nr:zinc finger protein 426-like [Scomber scombrus]